MELSITLVLKIAFFLVVVLVVISSFSDLTWLMKLRITLCFLAGVIFIGVLLWPLVEPNEPYGIVTLPGLKVISILAISAFLTGLAGYFLAWPYGVEIGVLTVPIGLSVWAVSTGSIADLMQRTSSIQQRAAILAPFKWEPIFWLALVFIGFAGVFVGQLIKKPQGTTEEIEEETNSKSSRYSNMVTALIGSAVIALFCINIFAQDVKLSDNRLGFVIAQPAVGQIAFAVFASFAIASFVIKKFLSTSYLWPVVCTAILPAFCISFYAKTESLSYISEKYPPIFFTNSTVAILPIQMVAFGVLGSIAGYWLVVRYNYWRSQENQ